MNRRDALKFIGILSIATPAVVKAMESEEEVMVIDDSEIVDFSLYVTKNRGRADTSFFADIDAHGLLGIHVTNVQSWR